jgi:cytochrome c556
VCKRRVDEEDAPRRRGGRSPAGDEEQGRQRQDIQNKFKAGNIEAIAVNAENLAIDADQIPGLFPKGSLTEKSRAKPDIWQSWPEFEAASKNLETWSVRLRDAVRRTRPRWTRS